MKIRFIFALSSLVVAAFVGHVFAQDALRSIPSGVGGKIEIYNPSGRIEILSSREFDDGGKIDVQLYDGADESDLEIKGNAEKLKIRIDGKKGKGRIDLKLFLPSQVKIKAETEEGIVSLIGEFREAKVKTDTGTIHTDVPLNDVEYKFAWLASQPKLVSEVNLADAREKAAGVYEIKGVIKEEPAEVILPRSIGVNSEDIEEESEEEIETPQSVSLDFRTYRGIVLLNVNPNQIPPDITERPLTHAAEAIIRSGNTVLTEAIRRAAPKHFQEFEAGLEKRDDAPELINRQSVDNEFDSDIKRVTVQVTDIDNRAISGLGISDFELSERGEEREILGVENSDEPFNLVLLLDVSGSVEYYVDFVRKAARNFLRTASAQDRIAIVIFNDDVKVLANLMGDREFLSESLDTFDAGGGTAFYDALAFGLVDILEPLQGERTAIVVLSDGDDNRSFLPFDSLRSSIEESGVLIYPLFVPSGLIEANADLDPSRSVDPMRSRYLTLTSKAQKEGEELARISGGVYHPISRLDQLQTSYEDIVSQLRTAYTITYKSGKQVNIDADNQSPRLRVKVKKDGAFIKAGKPSIGKIPPRISQSLIKPEPQFRNVSLEKEFPEKGRSNEQSNEISAEIEQIDYQATIRRKLKEFALENLDINKAPGAFLIGTNGEKMAVSRWISPKRTRSYPYARVYDTISFAGKRVAVIPVVKDEGLGGDRDFIQWDTISLLSLIDVHIILAYYSDAIKNERRFDTITEQKFDNEFVKMKLEEVLTFDGSSRDWNELEAKRLASVLKKAKGSYDQIREKTKTYLHNNDALLEMIEFAETPQRFIGYSRRKATKAQARESLTIQPKESLSTLSKGTVTIRNALFGRYYFTVDETLFEDDTIHLIEAKHTNRGLMPSKNDVKDGLIKMMLYTNLKNVTLDGKNVNSKVAIRITSKRLEGRIDSNSNRESINRFSEINKLSKNRKNFVEAIFKEANTNNFKIIIEHGD